MAAKGLVENFTSNKTRMVKREDSDKDELNDGESYSTEVASHETEQTQLENTIDQRLQNTKDIVSIGE